jgi:alpha-mannosidase
MRSRLQSFLILLLAVSLAGLRAQQVSSAQPVVYIVPFSHLDLFWLGTQEECLSRGNRVISKAIQLAEHYPEFRFLLEDEDFVANFVDSSRGSTELDTFKRLVKEGRIEIAPKWAAIYQNLPRGEALVRNVVYGKRYAREVFGVDPRVAHLGDIPGFTRQYPQILSKADTPYAVVTRMFPPDHSLFHWKAPDGSAILAWHTIKGYGWGVDLGLHLDLDEARLAAIDRAIGKVQATTAGPLYMGWGGDLWAPSQKLIENIALLSQRLAPRHFRLATAGEFFRAAADTTGIPELSGEIPSSWANLTTSLLPMWPPLISATDTLLNAEKFAAINYALGYAPYPDQEFDSLWMGALKSMDHNDDGQGGDIGDERKVGYAQEASLHAGQILRDSLRNIAERVQHPFPTSTPIVVFNPLSWTRDDLVKTHVTLFGDVSPGEMADYKKAMRLVDEKGTSIPFQVEQYSEWSSRALDLVFIARGVPSLGYKTYYLVPAEKPDAFPDACGVKLQGDLEVNRSSHVMGSDVLENEYYRVTIDRATGRVEIFDKELNRTVAKDIEIAAAEERGGDDLSIVAPTGRTIIDVIGGVELEENGPVRTVVRINGDVAGMRIVQRLALYRGLKKIDLENSLDWKPGRPMNVEQVFPLHQPNGEVRNGIPFGSAATADLMPNAGPRNGDEIPKNIWKRWRQIQDWVFAGSKEWGFTVSADHQFLTVGDTAIRAGMLRGTRYHPLAVVQGGQPILYPCPQAGTYVFHYSLTSGKGDWAPAKSWRAGMAFNMPLIPVSAVNELSQKPLPPERSFFSIDADNLVLTALKKADRDGAIVLRVFEIRGDTAESPVRFLGRDRSFRAANLLEEDLPTAEQNRLRVQPYEISTVKLLIR